MGYISNSNGLRLSMINSWNNKIIINKYNKDNFIINTIKNYKKVAYYYNIRKFVINSPLYKKLKLIRTKQSLFKKAFKTKKFNLLLPYFGVITKNKFSNKSITKIYNSSYEKYLKNKKEKFYSIPTINFKNNKINLNINYLFFKKIKIKKIFNYINIFNFKKKNKINLLLNLFFNNIIINNKININNIKIIIKLILKLKNKILNIYKKKNIKKNYLLILIKFNFIIKIIKIIFNKNINNLILLKLNLINKLIIKKFLINFFKKNNILLNKYKLINFLNSNYIKKFINNFLYFIIYKFAFKQKNLLTLSNPFSKYFFLKYKFINNNFNYNLNKIKYNNLNSNILNDYIIKKLKNNYTYFSTLLPLMKELNKNKNILGYKIKCKGRFDRNPRALYKIYKFGKIQFNNFQTPLSYNLNYIPLKFGVSTIKLWLSYKNLKYYNIINKIKNKK